ncbi:MAG: bi-domain-containing oxidoreductase, partial [Nitrososphaerota archaeon]
NMKQVFLKNGKITVEDVPPPALNDNEVLVANSFSVISSGTESAAIRKSKKVSGTSVLNPKFIRKAINNVLERGLSKTVEIGREYLQTLEPVGYSCAGYVIEVGRKVRDINIGDRVACGGVGKANHAEVVAVPRNLVAKVPANVKLEEACFTTLGAIAMQGIRRAGLQLGETVLIYGAGLLGQLGVQIAVAAGLRVIVADINEERVKLAQKMGSRIGLIIGKDDIKKEVLYHTNGFGVDAVVIYAATASSEPVNQAMHLIRKKGKVVVVGSVGMNLERGAFYEKEADFLMSRSYGPGRYDPLYEEKGIDYPIDYVRWTENRNMQAFLNLLEERKINITTLISAIFPIEEAGKAYELILSKDKKALGVLLKYEPSKYISSKERISRPMPTVEISPRLIEGKINVALIGAGNFARSTILPIISRISDYNLRAIVTATGINSKQIAIRYKTQYCTTDYKNVLEDKNIQLAIIATRHDLHYPMILDAARAGKAIFVEKPMCLTEEELEEIVRVISDTKVPLIVGFNRRYSPLSKKAKELLKQKHKPYIINYRVNAPFLGAEHWVHDPEVGGGRIIAECCHFFDLFNYFIQSDVEQIRVETASAEQPNTICKDNISVTMKWKDGSLTTLIYTTLGHENLPKERIEIFADHSSIIIDDFRKMKLYGFEEMRNIELKEQDKGHYQEFIELAKFLKGNPSEIISFKESVDAMRITFEVEKTMRGSKNK